MFDKLYKDSDQKMHKAREAVVRDFGHLRTGRANVAMVDGVFVEQYGASQPLKAVANISTPDGSTILITPWDRSLVGAIEKAIQAANLGMNPSSDGTNVRLTIPPLTQDRRKEIVKEAHKIAEHGRIAIRNIRHNANEEVKKLEKGKTLTEDEAKKSLKKVQDLTDGHIKAVDEMLAKKEVEIMAV